MCAKQPQGSFLSNTEINPREYLKAVTLRSGRQVEAKAEDSSSAKKDGVIIQKYLKVVESVFGGGGSNSEQN